MCQTCMPFVLCTDQSVTVPNCFIIPINPSVLTADGGISNGTSNVTMRCFCLDFGFQEIRWYSSDKKEIMLKYAAEMPYLIQDSGTLVFPIFSDSHQGIYYCGVRSNSMFAANISLTLWTTGMYMVHKLGNWTDIC